MFWPFSKFDSSSVLLRSPSLGSSPSPVPNVEKTLQVNFGEETVNFTLRKKRGCRNIVLRVDERGLRVTAPLRSSDGEVIKFVTTKQSWIAKHLGFYKNLPLLKSSFQTGDFLPYLGENCSVVLSEGKNKRPKIEKVANTFFISSNFDAVPKKFIKKWYLQQAEQVIGERVEIWKQKFGASVNSVSIRSQRSRWGSCSTKGNLNFNWKLVMAPLDVVDYLVIHELTHLRHMNHSGAFWETVEMHCPDYADKEKWLKQNGPMLSF